jgi:hypothetical protein
MLSSILKSTSNIGNTESYPIKNFFLGVTPKIMKPLDRIFQKYTFNKNSKIENFRLRIEFLEKSVQFLITPDIPNDFLIIEIQLDQPDFFTEYFFYSEKEIKDIANDSIFNKRFTVNLKQIMELIQMESHNYIYILFNFDNYKNLLNFKTVISQRSQYWLKDGINFYNDEYMLINEFEGEILFTRKFNVSPFFEIIKIYEDTEEGGCEYKLFFEMNKEENSISIIARNYAKIEYGIEEIRFLIGKFGDDIDCDIDRKYDEENEYENINNDYNDDLNDSKVFNLKNLLNSFPKDQDKVLYSWEKYIAIFDLFKSQVYKVGKNLINQQVKLTFYDNYSILFDFEFMEGKIQAKTILYPLYDDGGDINDDEEANIHIINISNELYD